MMLSSTKERTGKDENTVEDHHLGEEIQNSLLEK
jgi:hypothetical protein